MEILRGIKTGKLKTVRHVLLQFICLLGLIVILIIMTGCNPSPEPQFRFNRVALLKQEKNDLAEGERFSNAYQSEIGDILTALYGTPNEPRFPFLLGEEDPAHDVLSLNNLQLAAGPVAADRLEKTAGLYREHCSHCHGITGDGAGGTAASLEPYPRDFRLGKFKFKSTPLRRMPTNDDLTRILKNGIPGTAMPSFRTLPDNEIAALVDYVKYLTIRGQHERRLIAELSNLDDAPILDFKLLADADEEGQPIDEEMKAENTETFEAQLYTVVGEYLAEDIIPRWVDPDDEISEVNNAPAGFQSKHPAHSALLQTGKDLFYGKANCVQCHGETGLGDGQTANYDDWTNDWLKTIGVDVNQPATYQDFMMAGALHPRPIRPRNLRTPIFRGGNLPSDVYRRIANGIEGTPMPSSPTLTTDEIWALVSYVKSLPFEDQGSPENELPVNDRIVD